MFPLVVGLFQDLLWLFNSVFTFLLGFMNPLDLHVRLIRLGCSQDIWECQVVTKVCEEQSCVDWRVVVVVICKLCHWKEVGPIILTVRTEHVEICFHPLVVVFDLCLCLQMIGSWEVGFNSESLIKWAKKLIHRKSNFACESSYGPGNKGKPVRICGNKARYHVLYCIKYQIFDPFCWFDIDFRRGPSCVGISQSWWFLIETNVGKTKEGRGLEACLCANGIRDLLLSTHAGGNRISKRGREWVWWLTGLLDLIPKQLPKSTTGAQSVLVVNTLTRCNTEGADWSGVLVWLASPAVLQVGISMWGWGNGQCSLEVWSPCNSEQASEWVGILNRARQGTEYQMSIIEMLSEVPVRNIRVIREWRSLEWREKGKKKKAILSHYCTFGANRPFLFLYIFWEIDMTSKHDWCNNQVEMVIKWNCGYGNLLMQLDIQLVWGTILGQWATPQQGTKIYDS